MSLFDYPRINFKGEIQLNPGTANNDDYAQQPSFVLPPNGPDAGQPLALIDSNITVAFLLLSARAERPPGELYARVTMR
jgi:hypothetical protein